MLWALLFFAPCAAALPQRCTVGTLAGIRGANESVDGAFPSAATFGFPTDVRYSPSQAALYVTDSGRGPLFPTNGNRVRRLSLRAQSVDTAIGTGARTPFANGPALSATLARPTSVAVDAAGNMYIADTANRRIRLYNASTGAVSTLCGTGAAGQTLDGNSSVATIRDITYLVLNPERATLEFVEYTESTVRSVSLSQPTLGTITTAAGLQLQWDFVDGVGSNARFHFPVALAYSSIQQVYVVADTYNNAVRIMAVNGAGQFVVATLAGSGASGWVDGPGLTAQFQYPYGVAFDEQPALPSYDPGVLVIDRNQRLRWVGLSDSLHNVTTLAGSGDTGGGENAPASVGSEDGPGTSARFNFPQAPLHLPNATREGVEGVVTYLVADTLNCLLRVVECRIPPVPSVSGTPSPAPAPMPASGTHSSSPSPGAPAASPGASGGPSTAPGPPQAAAAAEGNQLLPVILPLTILGIPLLLVILGMWVSIGFRDSVIETALQLREYIGGEGSSKGPGGEEANPAAPDGSDFRGAGIELVPPGAGVASEKHTGNPLFGDALRGPAHTPAAPEGSTFRGSTGVEFADVAGGNPLRADAGAGRAPAYFGGGAVDSADSHTPLWSPPGGTSAF